MGNLNKVLLIGRLGKDPEKRVTSSGKSVVNITLATTDFYKDQSGNRQENTEWHKLVFWGKIAEIIERYCRKGSQIYAEGSLRTREWQDKDGNKRYTTQVNVRQFQFLDKKGDTQQDSVRNQQMNIQTNNGDLIEDDIPF